MSHGTRSTPVRDDADKAALTAFLTLLGHDIQEHPERLRSISPALVQRVQALTENVEIDLDANLSANDE